MAKLIVFGVYDIKAGFYKNPFMMKSTGEALRGFADLANDTKTEVGRHPEDFALFKLAKWDEETGVYENDKAPESLGTALNFVVKPLTEVVKGMN